MQGHNVEKNKIEKQIENLIRGVSILSRDTRFYFYDGLGFSSKRQTGMITSKQAWVTDKKVVFGVFWVKKLLKGLTDCLTVSPLYSFSPFLYKQSFYPICIRVASAPDQCFMIFHHCLFLFYGPSTWFNLFAFSIPIHRYGSFISVFL